MPIHEAAAGDVESRQARARGAAVESRAAARGFRAPACDAPWANAASRDFPRAAGLAPAGRVVFPRKEFE
jgi:hypothetical protein